MKTRRLVIMFGSFVLLTAAFTGITFAWINYQENISGAINIASSSLKVNSLTATAYKYVYPSFSYSDSDYDLNYDLLDSSGNPTSEEILINYNGEGAVRSKAISADYPIKMNVFDPQYLLLNRYNKDADGNPTPETISSLKTTMVVAVDYSLTYSFPICVSLDINKKAQTTSNLAATNYLHFCAAVSTDTNFSTLTSSSTDQQIYDCVKTYEENVADNHNFLEDDDNGDSCLDLVEKANIGASAVPSETTSSFRIYVAFDYDEWMTGVKKYNASNVLIDDYASKLFGIDYIGKTQAVEMDYTFSLCVSQREAS